MARIRTIKPEFWSDGVLMECSLNARLLFIGTWNFADDNGNLDRSAKQIKARIFPADPIDCEPLIQELLAHGRLIEYSVSGQKYLHIHKFSEHQVINRPSKPHCPIYEPSLSTPGVIREDSGLKGREGKGKEEIHVGLAPDASPLSKNSELRKTAAGIISFLNSKAGRNFDVNGANADHVIARLKDGESADDLRAVVAKKCRDWKGDEKMVAYLRPETLFNRTKFASYKGELNAVS